MGYHEFCPRSLLTHLAYLISKQFEYPSNIKWLPNWVRLCYGFHQIQLSIPNLQLEQVPLVFQVSNQANILYKWFIFNLSLKKLNLTLKIGQLLRPRNMDSQWRIHRNPKLLGMGRQFGQINYGAFGVFLADLLDSTHFDTVSPLSMFFIISTKN